MQELKDTFRDYYVSVTGKKWDDGTTPAAVEKDDLNLDDIGLEPMDEGEDEGGEEELDEEAKREAEALSARTRKLVVQEDGSVARRGTRKREPAVSKQDAAKQDLQPILRKKWKKYNDTKRKKWKVEQTKAKKAAAKRSAKYIEKPFKELDYKSWLAIYERTENDKEGEVIGSLRGKRNREDDDDDDDLDDDEYDEEVGLPVEGADGEGEDDGEQQDMVVDGDDSEQGSSDVDEEQVSILFCCWDHSNVFLFSQAEFAHLDNRVNIIVDDYIHLMEGKGSDPGLAKAYKAVQSSHENCEKADAMDAQLIGKFKTTVEALEEKLEKYLEVSAMCVCVRGRLEKFLKFLFTGLDQS